MVFPKLEESFRRKRLERPQSHPVRMVLDTDAFNEVDDQFAIAYSVLKRDKLRLEAVYAAPFYNDNSDSFADGMEKSYQEILRVLALTDSTAAAFRGSVEKLPDCRTPVESEAARDLIRRAMVMPTEEPLYVASIGAITNVASAILLEPEIIRKIVVIWLGGNEYSTGRADEFNCSQDICAAQVIFDSGVPLVQLPAIGCTAYLTVTGLEFHHFLGGRSGLPGFLYERVMESEKKEARGGSWSRVIWDVAAPMWLANECEIRTRLVQAPAITSEGTYAFPPDRHTLCLGYYMWRDNVVTDLFSTITGETVDVGYDSL